MREELDKLISNFKETASSDTQIKINKAISELKRSEKGKGLNIGDKAPNFKLLDVSGQKIELYEQLKTKLIILVFYRGGWCPYCNVELRGYQNIIKDIHEVGAEVIAISPEVIEESINTREKNKLDFYVLSDQNNDAINKYKLEYELPPYIIDLYKKIKVPLDKYNGRDDWILPSPATFIINREGTIVYKYNKSDYRERAEPSEILKVIKD